ncbi:MAG: hypothetical protein K2X43_08355 [Hyphomonadaceae bacterium]|nr:hypothetical protein [Hyphomonadaceae bacterium]
MSRIEIAALSEAQRAQLAIYGARWTALRRATSPPNHESIADGVRNAYAAGGLTPPGEIVWERGPADLASGWAKRRGGAGDNVRSLIVDAVRRKAELAVDRAISLSVRMVLANEPGLSRAAEFSASIDEAVLRISERTQPALRTRLADFFPGRRRRLSFAASSFSPLSAPWLGSLQYLHDIGGLRPHTEALVGLWTLARSASWIVPHARVCWLMERPELIRHDVNGRLHAPDGPALRYGDGCKVYAWKGILLPARIIEQRERIDVRSIEAAHDPQIRRCMIDVMTPQRFIEQGGAYRVAQDDVGILWRQRWRWEAWAAVEVINGTAEPDGTYKRYFLQVPPTVRTPREAVAWTYGLSERHYRPTVRT